MLEITPLLDEENKTPIYLQLYIHIKNEIESERFPAYAKLPSIRKLASYLEISQNTVEYAYQQLLAEGYIESQPRRGMYVIPLEKKLGEEKRTPTSKHEQSNNVQEILINFHQASVDLNHFPINDWRKCSNEVLLQQRVFQYGDPQGELKLREHLASYLHLSRGVNCTPEQIIVGAGTQHLLGMLCLIFKRKQFTVAIENPGYKGARDVFINHGFDLKQIRVDSDGVSIDEIRKSKCQVVYMTPSHQYPTGVITPVNKRRQLLKWASECERYIIEDDYDSEFRYVGKPIPSFQGLDTNEKVIYLGTLSKSFLPSVRISYMVLPFEILGLYKEMYVSYDQTVSKIHQEALALFMEQGHFDRHIRRVRKVNRQKRDTLLKAISTYMGENVQVVGEKSGVYILLEIKRTTSESLLIEQALTHKVKVYPTSVYWMDASEAEFPKLQLGFGGLTETEIEEGIKLLNKAWF